MVALAVIAIVLLTVFVIYLLISGERRREEKEVEWKAMEEKLKELTSKQEDVDVWKKACWDAESRNLATSGRLCEIEAQLSVANAEIAKVVNQKKSSEVRTGLIAEQLAPFIEGFPVDPRTAVFLGKPLDYVAFTDNGVYFIEVKSGESRLTDVQRRIKKDIEENRVYFKTFRINGG